ncbi:CBM35 domain-containing protein [Actinophytocola oryzae]|uniref:Carbohydrate-binding protein with CBM35 doain n=1 Tax=Actinophytocola oryzae TaxID=502181 RepID=A0A4R7W3G1_9PSEU|nr:CBM35 domain-containing protein [Actinophytocola oryzae]TDV57190.1 carbohydrate-binding protein with CBM35 doain [Actinophytocola oryzae]
MLKLTLTAVLAALIAAAGVVAGDVVASAATSQEAEAPQLAGGARVESEHPGYTGSGYVGGFVDANRGNATAVFTLTGVTSGGNDLTIRYANGTGAARTMSLVVNGTSRQISLPATSNWDTWGTTHQTVTLTAGTNTVVLRYGMADNGNVNLDNLAVAALPAAPGLEAESSTLSGGAVVESEHPGYSGTGYVGGFVDANRGNATATFTVAGATSGNHNLTVRYANGTGATRTMSLLVNGSTRQIALPATANWDTWTSTTEQVTLNAGTNTIALRYGTADNGNVNVDNLVLTTALPATGGELETAFLSGGATVGTDVSGYTGSGFVTGLAVGARVIRTVNASTAGTQAATLRFRNATGGSRTLSLYVNGLRQTQVTLPAGDWQTASSNVPLRAGVNLVGYQVDQGDTGGVQLDNVAVAGTTALATRGATLPYTTYEAEAGSTNGRVLAADRTYTTRQAEASGRRAVELTGSQYVQVTLTKPANAITVRASIPDNAAGTGITAPLAVYAGATKVTDLTLTSKYTWMYGPYPFAGAPGGERQHRYFDDSRVLLPTTYPAGTVLKLAKETTAADSITVDLLDAEVADPALTAPTGYVNVNSYGAVPNDSGDDTNAIRSAISAAQSNSTRGVWLPAGRYVVSGLLDVATVSVRGAGIWHTVLQGINRRGGFMAGGGNVQLADFTFDGDVTTRDPDGAPNSDAAFEGDFGTGSLIHHVATNHAKVGLWVKGNTNGLYVSAVRLRNTMADGVNVNGNATNVRVEQSTLRNTGDDALAMWSYAGAGGTVRDSVFAFNTVATPILANGAAVYGGANNRVEDNTITDTVFQGSGVTVSNWHDATPFSGTTTVARNTLTRTGTHSLDWGSDLGAVWLYAPTTAMTGAVVLRDLTVNDSTYQGLLTSWQQPINNLTVERVAFNGTGTIGMEFNTPGSGTFGNVTVSGNGGPALANNAGFAITRGPGNTGW